MYAQNTLLTGLKTGHVGLNVSDLARSEAFYTAVFGLTPITRSDDPARPFLFLGDGERLVLTLWQQSAGEFATGLPGLHHLSFEAESMDVVREAEIRLKSIGAPLLHDGIAAHREGARSGGIFFTDPDGIRLEIYAATGAEEAPAPTGEAPTCGFF